MIMYDATLKCIVLVLLLSVKADLTHVKK